MNNSKGKDKKYNLIDLQGIGPRVVGLLEAVGIDSPEKLTEVGAMEAYLRIVETGYSPHLALLYALVGAVEDRDWRDVAQKDKARLTAELEVLQDMGVDILVSKKKN